MTESLSEQPHLVVPLLFFLVHVTSTWTFQLRRRHEHRIGSFSGGLAVAYVFLHLVPELLDAHDGIGQRIHLLTLGGFCGFYLLDRIDTVRFWQRLGLMAAYNLLMVFTLGEQLPASAALTGLYLLAISMHLMADDHDLLAEEGALYRRWGPPALALSVILGGAGIYLHEHDEVFVDVLTALLTGFVLFNVFSEELSEEKVSHLGWFIGGVAFLSAIEFMIN